MDLTNWISEEPEAPQETKTQETKELAGSPIAEKIVSALPWTEKYRPKNLSEILGNPSTVESLKKWAGLWAQKIPTKRAVILYGNVGSGKTSLAYALAKEFNWELLEMNASDKRSQDVIQRIAGLGSQTRSFSGKRKVILVEEIEGLSGIADRGASKALIEVIKATDAPIILTTNDINDKKLGNLKRYCEHQAMRKVSPGTIVKKLKDIAQQEGIGIPDIAALQKIADNAEGDMRSAINDLQAVAQGEKSIAADSIFLEQRDRPIDVHRALQKIFRCNDYSECRRILWDLNEEPRNFIAWLDENIPVEYKGIVERAGAFNSLSRADMFLGRVTNRQYWGFLRYVNDLMSVGVAFSKEKPNFEFTKYNFPSLIWKMGSTRSKRAKEASISSKISPIVHESKRSLINNYLPLIRRVFEKNRDAALDLLKPFDLEPEELDMLAK